MAEDEADHRPLYCKVIDRLSPPVSECWDEHRGFLAENAPGPLGVKLLFAASYADSDIANGGFFQFFTNSTGVVAPEAVEGLRLIGLPKSASLFLKAMEYFGDAYPRDRVERRAVLEALPGYPDIFRREEWDPFLKLGDKYYKSRGGSDGFKKAANKFVKQFEHSPRVMPTEKEVAMQNTVSLDNKTIAKLAMAIARANEINNGDRAKLQDADIKHVLKLLDEIDGLKFMMEYLPQPWGGDHLDRED